ncbi:hypothetical protein QAD02_003330 [Eretmocerus hayati]|uniref:Uncharacterized protein n=1 Tax=Eretmocerus hayati TaxID=131215 RepID=A0ACC2NN80_9HYME|nr:hypothetical protein QAD02_003330 [Eretmocerus hayati]
MEEVTKRQMVQIWDEEACTKFREAQKSWEKTENWEELGNRIEIATATIELEDKETDFQDWWDEECWRKKIEVQKLFQDAKEDKIDGHVYYAKRREYRQLLDKKKRKEAERKVEGMLRDKSEKKFWKMDVRIAPHRISENRIQQDLRESHSTGSAKIALDRIGENCTLQDLRESHSTGSGNSTQQDRRKLHSTGSAEIALDRIYENRTLPDL